MKISLIFCGLLLAITLRGQSPTPELQPLEAADSLRTLAGKTQGVEKALTLFELAKMYSLLDIDSTRFFIDEALAICKELKNDTLYIEIAARMQDPLGNVGEKDLALKYLISAKALRSPEALETVEAYIRQHHHLPDVPSAVEVAKDGLKLGEMNATLLKKVEELTLYVIELKKQNDIAMDEINKLKKGKK